RRHTRFSRDWSSDVCSSDLTAEDRQQTLHRAALAYGDHRPDGAAGELRAMLAPHYFAFMRGHLQLQEYEQTEYLLGKHRRLGYPEGQVAFFTGELHRLRKAEGDGDKAIDRKSTRLNSSHVKISY